MSQLVNQNATEAFESIDKAIADIVGKVNLAKGYLAITKDRAKPSQPVLFLGVDFIPVEEAHDCCWEIESLCGELETELTRLKAIVKSRMYL